MIRIGSTLCESTRLYVYTFTHLSLWRLCRKMLDEGSKGACDKQCLKHVKASNPSRYVDVWPRSLYFVRSCAVIVEPTTCLQKYRLSCRQISCHIKSEVQRVNSINAFCSLSLTHTEQKLNDWIGNLNSHCPSLLNGQRLTMGRRVCALAYAIYRSKRYQTFTARLKWSSANLLRSTRITLLQQDDLPVFILSNITTMHFKQG